MPTKFVERTDLQESTFPKVFSVARCEKCLEPTELPNAVGVKREVVERAVAAGKVVVTATRPTAEFDGETGLCDDCAAPQPLKYEQTGDNSFRLTF
jgi:hypothetical protein